MLRCREMIMLKSFEDIQKYGKANMDATMKVWGQVSKGAQAIAAETANYSKKSLEEGSAALQKLLGAKSLENAIEIHTAYAKRVYEGFVAQATKMGALYADLAQETSKPFETLVPQVLVAKAPVVTASAAEPAGASVLPAPAPKAPALEPTESPAPAPKAAAPPENFVPPAPASKAPASKAPAPKTSTAKPIENLVPQTPAPKAPVAKVAAPKSPAPKSPAPKAPATKPPATK